MPEILYEPKHQLRQLRTRLYVNGRPAGIIELTAGPVVIKKMDVRCIRIFLGTLSTDVYRLRYPYAIVFDRPLASAHP